MDMTDPLQSRGALSVEEGLMQYTWHRKGEGSDRRVEVLTVVGHHLVGALHRSHRRLEDRAARVAETLAGLEVGLLADHAVAAHFLHLAVGVGDDPVSRHQSRRYRAFIADRYGVGEHEAPLARVGLLVDEVGLDVDANLVALVGIGGHGCQCSLTASTSQGEWCSTVSSVKLSRMASP